MFSKKPKGATVQEDDKGGLSGLLWMFIGAVFTLSVGVYAYTSSSFGLGNKEAVKPIQVQKIKMPSEKVSMDKTNKASYEFYDLLPDENIPTVAPIEKKEQTASEAIEQIEKEAQSFKPDVVVTDTKTVTNTKTSNIVSNSTAHNATNRVISPNSVSVSAKQQLVTQKNLNKNQTAIKTQKPIKTEDIAAVKPVRVTKNSVSKQTNDSNNNSSINTRDSVQKSNSEKLYTDTNPDMISKENVVIVRSSDDIQKLGSKSQEKSISAKASVAAEKISEPQTNKASVTKIDRVIEQKPKTKNKSYILQINSYTSSDEADKRRAQVLMAGVDANVINSSNGMYRVISSSMFNPKSVLETQRKLQKSGIDSVVVEQRR